MNYIRDNEAYNEILGSLISQSAAHNHATHPVIRKGRLSEISRSMFDHYDRGRFNETEMVNLGLELNSQIAICRREIGN
jgi:hypothetical protein